VPHLSFLFLKGGRVFSSYTNDQLNRPTQKAYPDNTTVNYTYNNDSRLTRSRTPPGLPHQASRPTYMSSLRMQLKVRRTLILIGQTESGVICPRRVQNALVEPGHYEEA